MIKDNDLNFFVKGATRLNHILKVDGLDSFYVKLEIKQ